MIQRAVYLAKDKDSDSYYVGKTENLSRRACSHKNSKKAPRDIVEAFTPVENMAEEEIEFQMFVAGTGLPMSNKRLGIF